MSEHNFEGFIAPRKNFFHMPNCWIDICADITNLAELKIVQYVLRHTWGYHEYGIKKTITTDEFMHGRKRTDGSRIDKGTGLSNRSVIDGLRSAIQHGYLEVDVDETDRARKCKSYALKMVESDVKNLHIQPNHRCEEPSYPSPTIDVKNLHIGYEEPSYQPEESSHRSEKDTKERHLKKDTKDIPPTIVSPPKDLTTNVVALPSFSSEQEQRKPKNKSIRSEVQDDDEAQERRRGIYQRIVARRGYEIDGKARISEYAAIKQLAEKYTDEQIEAIHRYLFETDWRWSKMDNQYKIGACVIAAEAQSVLQILKTKTPSSPAVSAPPIPPKPMKSRLVQELDEKRERYARKKG